MKVFQFMLNFALPVVLATNAPSNWKCAPLNKISSSVDGCVASSSYADGVWDIGTSTEKTGTGVHKFCVISLFGEGVNITKDFYVKAHFSNGQKGRPGPFGGIAFNMEDVNNGNYIMMRLRVPTSMNVQMGMVVKGIGQGSANSKVKNNAVASGAALLEILVQDDDETVWIDGVLEESISAAQPYFIAPGHVGFAFQSVTSWPAIRIQGAEVCVPVTCTDEDGTVYSGGEQWKDEEGRTCTCLAEGINRVCGDEALVCSGDRTKWTDPITCFSKCIKAPAYCSSTSDPHFRTFDGRYYSFHGKCTYQAASCGDFVVNLKNYHPATWYTRKIELQFKGQLFSIEAGYQASVDGNRIAGFPYIKTYTNGDRIEIRNNGQLEMSLYNKGRNPSVRTRATNRGTWIQAYIWLHGSCGDDITEGLCGNWNGDSNDDLINNSITEHAKHYEKYDEHCPEPPKPYHPCDDIVDADGYAEAEKLCSALEAQPFTQCHTAVPIGTREEGPLANCITDVCHCWLEQNCACDALDAYAETCIEQGVDLRRWRYEVDYCPYECPESQVYMTDGAIPQPSCLERNPVQNDTSSGCFCPRGLLLQNKTDCVTADECRCLFEGDFYENGDKIEKKAECQVCTCEDAGEMVCDDMVCPVLDCSDNEIEATKDDDCCPYCDDSWVEAINSNVTVKKGQKIILTCAVHTTVPKSAITWHKDETKIKKSMISGDRLRLTIDSADAEDDGEYRCQATKDGKVNSAFFEINVVMPARCEHEDGHQWEEGTIYKPQETEECSCDPQAAYHCTCVDDEEECEDPTPVVWFNEKCVKTCIPEHGLCTAAADPHYRTFDGSEFAFKGDCKYNFFGCGEIKMYADHEKDKASTSTKYLEIAFKNDVFRLEGDQVKLNGDVVIPAIHKEYSDGSRLKIDNVGQYIFTIHQDGKDPFVELSWDKVSSYNLKVHGTCQGQSTGMCGKWNGEAKDDWTIPGGKLAASVEEFGTAWAVDDEEDCPEPEPAPDTCEVNDQEDERAGYEARVQSVLNFGVLGNCSKVVDNTNAANSAVLELCGCWGSSECACPIFNQFAAACDHHGFKTAGWAVANKNSGCAPACPEGSFFRVAGPKPAPSCANSNGGRQTQPGCFCRHGQVLEGEQCINAEECKCEYAGQRYDTGDTYDKLDICQTCECVGSGEEECRAIECNTQCQEDEIEMSVEGECCTQCLADWVEPVNPRPEATLNEPLALTCRVTGIEVTADDIKWIKFSPEVDVSKLEKMYGISDDGLVLTIKSVNEKRVGNYKCVVTKDDKVSEGVFEVTVPIVHEDLIEAVKDTILFTEGRDLVMEVKKLSGTIIDLHWECNGVRMERKIINKKTSCKLVLKKATADMAGTCTCIAQGIGSQDRAEFTIKGQANKVTVTLAKTSITCNLGETCSLRCTVKKTAGKVKPRAVKVYKMTESGKRTDCKATKKLKNKFTLRLGQVSASVAGQYVCVHSEAGVDTVSVPATVSVKG